MYSCSSLFTFGLNTALETFSKDQNIVMFCGNAFILGADKIRGLHHCSCKGCWFARKKSYFLDVFIIYSWSTRMSFCTSRQFFPLV